MRKSLEFSVDETGFKKIALDVHLFYWQDNASHMHNFNEEINFAFQYCKQIHF